MGKRKRDKLNYLRFENEHLKHLLEDRTEAI